MRHIPEAGAVCGNSARTDLRGGRGVNFRSYRNLQDFRADYARLKNSWGGYGGFDAWVAGANNAAFGTQAIYDEWVPAFETLFDAQGKDWPRFYDAVRRLAQLPAPERARALKQLSTERTSG